MEGVESVRVVSKDKLVGGRLAPLGGGGAARSSDMVFRGL